MRIVRCLIYIGRCMHMENKLAEEVMHCMIIASLIIIQLLQLFVDGDDILRSMQEELIGNFAKSILADMVEW